MASQFIRNSLFGILAGLGTTLGNFISGLLVARILGVELTGTVTFVIWLTNMLVTIFVAGIPPTLGRYLPEISATGEAHTAPSQLLSYLFRPFLLFVLLPVIGLLLYAAWLFYHGHPFMGTDRTALENPVVFIIVAACCGSQALADYVKAYFRGMQEFNKLARITTIAVFAQVFVIGVGGFLFGVNGALIGYVLGNGLPAFFIRKVIKGNKIINPELKIRVIRYARFRWAAEVMSAFVWSRIEVFFLAVWWGAEPVGLLTVGMSLANLAVQGPLMLTWGLLPRFTEQFGKSEFSGMNNAYQMATRLMALLVFPACFGLAAIIPQIVPLLFGEAFARAIPMAEILIFAAAIPAAATVGSNVLWAADRSDLDFYSGLAGMVIAIICGITIIPAFGAMGAVWSRIVTQLSVVALVSWLMSKKLPIHLPIWDLLKIGIAALFCAFIARLTLYYVSGLVGIPLAIIFAALSYGLALRLIKAIPANDAIKIRSLSKFFPHIVRRPLDFALSIIVP